jgi:nitrogen fixation/metabolism regulation signal transduction histidine kinase
MGSDLWRSAGFALGVAVRAALIGLLVLGVVLTGVRGFAATAVVLGVLAILAVIELAQRATAADRALAQFVEGMTAEGYERPVVQAGFARFAEATEQALGRLAAVRADRQRRIDHLEALVDNVAAALLVLDAGGQVVSANRAARQALGATPGPLSAVAPLGADAAGRLLALPAGAGEIVRLADGRPMLALAALFTAQGRSLRLVSLQALSGDLDAVEIKAWQDLTRVLAHEMMNSLTPICSLSESLSGRLRRDGGGVEPAAVAEAVDVIARRAAGLMSFVERYRRLTELPRAERSKLKAADVAESLGRLMAPEMAKAGVDYASVVRPKSLALRADSDLLEQALINLLKNALEAVRGRAGAAVRLGVAVAEGHVVVTVEDNGPGLPAGDPERAFVPFFTTKPGGSGVGLTLARQIAVAHGGRLEHSERPGGGAVFRLWIPQA